MSAPESAGPPMTIHYGETYWVITSPGFYHDLALTHAAHAAGHPAALSVKIARLPTAPPADQVELVLWITEYLIHEHRPRHLLSGWTMSPHLFNGPHSVGFNLVAYINNDDATITFVPDTP